MRSISRFWKIYRKVMTVVMGSILVLYVLAWGFSKNFDFLLISIIALNELLFLEMVEIRGLLKSMEAQNNRIAEKVEKEILEDRL
jgi:hypothetical protein